MALDFRPNWNIYMVINGVDHVDLGAEVIDEMGAEYTITSLPTVNSDNAALNTYYISLKNKSGLPSASKPETVEKFIGSYTLKDKPPFNSKLKTTLTWKLFIKINDKEPLQLGTVVTRNGTNNKYTVIRFPNLNSHEYYENMDKGWAADSLMYTIGFEENGGKGPTVEFFLKNYTVGLVTANGDPIASTGSAVAPAVASAVAPSTNSTRANLTLGERLALHKGFKPGSLAVPTSTPPKPVLTLEERLARHKGNNPAPYTVVPAAAPQQPQSVKTFAKLQEMLHTPEKVGGKRTKKQKRTKPKSKKRKTNRRR